MDPTVSFTVQPSPCLGGETTIPGDKSISHRAIMLGAIAEGRSEITGFLEGDDALATLAAFRLMGVDIETSADGMISIEGVGLHGLSYPELPLDLGNSGTSMRLMCGLLAGQRFNSDLVGDDSLSKRPMRRVTDPLAKMGGSVQTTPEGTPPLTILGRFGMLRGITYEMPIASAQIKSALLLAGLYADGKTCVVEPATTRDHTERMLRRFRYPVVSEGSRIFLEGREKLVGSHVSVPGDFSSAAFLLVAGAIATNAVIEINRVGINPTRIGALEILRLMGAELEIYPIESNESEPIARIVVRNSNLNGIRIPESLISSAIDELPIICVAAAFARGKTLLRGAKELRFKESDRIEAIADGLRVLGVEVETFEDGMEITPGVVRGGEVDSRNDHRIAMAFAVAGISAKDTVRIRNCRNVQTSFPNFVEILKTCGVNIEATNHK